MKKQAALFLLLALLISAASFCAGRKQALGKEQDPCKQEEYVDSHQQIDSGTNNFQISNVKLVKEVDMENIHIEYSYILGLWVFFTHHHP